MAINVKVNGATRSVNAEPDTPLLYVLRNDLELNAAKFGCGLAQCGACTVLIDGVATRSCVTPLGRVGQSEVTTLEGLGTTAKLHPLQQAFIDEQAAQCGYCTNGMIMAAKAFLDNNPNPPRHRFATDLRAISAAAAPRTASCAPSCARPRPTGGSDHERSPSDTPRFRRRAWRHRAGLQPGAACADAAGAAPAGQPANRSAAQRVDRDQCRRHRHRLHRQGGAGAGHPHRFVSDRGGGARPAARARQDHFRRYRTYAQ